MHKNRSIRQLANFILLAMMTGCATSTRDARDPLENWNRDVQLFNDNLDEYVGKPIANGYQWIMPSFADRGVTNFFSNINDIGVTINDLLQFKLSQAGMDGSRFIVNTVAGIGGFIDVAEMIDLPKHEEDFDQTLGVWGLPTGPYLVLPLFGPSSPRGIGGLIGDAAMNPVNYLDSGIITGSLSAVNWTDFRADNLGTEKAADEAALDRYEFFKNAYLQRRNYLVHDGNVPEEEKDELELDENNP
ncbi:MlaA family lipoprotein [Methylobacter sp. YRD-M1]|uniref:MlaA family lipoprotein n=1 Tax=Methylobacter sp. YRD-M1 TaxID=2911520 RepID=UPI00227CB10F|nr:VacJ family lipoprotein [Methylobacter sp. YRD-M1]WAK03462.1 VacJ family lipoprotein [Methylobacter sp. YRD-M1]